jgi:Plasmid pRiA4b ORF-3-like protein
MPQNDTLILRVALEHETSTFREIEIEASKSLYRLAEAIVAAFGFDFDHAFGFYSGLTPAKMMRTHPKYELFADMGEADPGVLSVKKAKVSEAFPAVGHTMVFLFDYGDDWRFRVRLTGTGTKVAKTRYPRVVASQGEAPAQYPDPEEFEDDDRPTFGINPVTGEKIKFR